VVRGEQFTEDDAEAHIHGICFKTGPPQRVGVELEWLVRDRRDPGLPVQPHKLAAAIDGLAAQEPGNPAKDEDHRAQARWLVRDEFPSLPSGASLTVEPGGQLEISSAPAATLSELLAATRRDMAALRDAAAAADLELCGYGLDPLRPPLRVLDLPRYAAMEKFFDRTGPWGRQMMCGTASVQVCLDAGDDGAGRAGYRFRWRLLHAIGPVLVAAFANSPLRGGRPTGWRSSRQQAWLHMDPGRTRAPADGDGRDPRDAWVSYALDAELMCVPDPGSPDWAAPPGLTFRGWLRDGAGSLRPPTREDLDYHLSTLFPPVRPRGHMELRMIDAQPGDGWIVPMAVAAALADDERAADAALAAAEPVWAESADTHEPWRRAARHGPEDPHLGRAARHCFEAADAALARADVPAPIQEAVAEFTERYVMKDRCPADDQLEQVR
jgi:ergothioneine biosynthesis glutamate--cysteine ligase EgtA